MAYYSESSLGKDRHDERFDEIFSEFDFCHTGDECTFFCPGCRNMMKCTAYADFKDDWEFFYM